MQLQQFACKISVYFVKKHTFAVICYQPLNDYAMKKHFATIVFLASWLFAVSVSAQPAATTFALYHEITSDLKNNILPFWEKYSVDPRGGFYGSLKRDGTPIADAPKGCVLNARILWTFSAAYRLYGNPSFRNLADRAQRYFIDYFIDPQYGGVYWQLTADGTPLNMDKQTYGCSYAIYGLSEHYRATGNTESLQKAIEIYRIMENKIKDPVNDGYIESFTRDWKTPEKFGYDGDGIATKTMNTHIHVLEAYTALYKVWNDNGLRNRLLKLTELLTTKLYDKQTHHLILYCNSEWGKLNDIDSYGHDIETAWLLTEAAETLNDPETMNACRKVTLELTDAALKEGINDMGALMYERHGDKIRRDASWWCQAETVVGCINAWQLTGKQSYLDSAERTWNFIKSYMIDQECGEWFRTVSAEGSPKYDEPKASMWNCPYHNSRMGFEVAKRLSALSALAVQTEVMAWSNMTGVRIDGELIDFESSFAVGTINGSMEFTKKEWQPHPRYHREANKQETVTNMRGVEFRQTVTDKEIGVVEVDIEVLSDTTLNQAAYFRVTLTPENYADAEIKAGGRQLSITSANRSLKLRFNRSLKISQEQEAGNTVIYVQLTPTLKKGSRYSAHIDLHASGTIDRSDALVRMNLQNPGNLFTGFGGNFRLQNPKLDPQVIDYCLNNLRVAYGRVEFPWQLWHPEEGDDPIAEAENGRLNPRVEQSLLMAQRLRAIGMPVILSCWFPPAWAIDGGRESYNRQGGVKAYRLDPQKKAQIYQSMADYLLYAKRHYGVEFAMFSFNESDLGIDVLHTPQEHADFIKEFGAYLAKLNLPTRMLLGDNSDATTFDFILPALNDETTHKYIGAQMGQRGTHAERSFDCG